MSISNAQPEQDRNAFDLETKPPLDVMGEWEPDMNTPLIPVLVGTPKKSETIYIRQMKLKEPNP